MYGFSIGSGMFNCFQVNFCNYCKVVVVDGECGFVGGYNVGVEYFGEKLLLVFWCDIYMELCGLVVVCLQESFVEDWYWVIYSLLLLILLLQYDSEGVFCQVVVSGLVDVQEICLLFFVEMINVVYEWVWIILLYFVFDEVVMVVLCLVVLCGVDVCLLIFLCLDYCMVYVVFSFYVLEVICVGVKVFCYQFGFFYQKVVLVDCDIVVVGSVNLDNCLFWLNFEVMVVIVDEGFVGEVEVMFEVDFVELFEFILEDCCSVCCLQ